MFAVVGGLWMDNTFAVSLSVQSRHGDIHDLIPPAFALHHGVLSFSFSLSMQIALVLFSLESHALVCSFSFSLRHRTVLSISVTGLALGMGHPHTNHASRGTHAHPLPFDSFLFSIHAVSFHTMHLDPLGMCNSLPVSLFSFLVTFQHELFALREADGRKVTLIVWVRRVWGNGGAQRRAVGARWGHTRPTYAAWTERYTWVVGVTM